MNINIDLSAFMARMFTTDNLLHTLSHQICNCIEYTGVQRWCYELCGYLRVLALPLNLLTWVHLEIQFCVLVLLSLTPGLSKDIWHHARRHALFYTNVAILDAWSQ